MVVYQPARRLPYTDPKIAMLGPIRISSMTKKNPYAALDAFVEEGLQRPFTHAAHIRFDHMTVFVRVASRYVDQKMTRTLDIATVDVDEGQQNKKVFSSFLNHAERLAAKKKVPVYVESILNENLAAALSNRGYDLTGEPTSPNAIFKVDQLSKKYSTPDDSPSP